jgi:hypothetical protein
MAEQDDIMSPEDEAAAAAEEAWNEAKDIAIAALQGLLASGHFTENIHGAGEYAWIAVEGFYQGQQAYLQRSQAMAAAMASPDWPGNQTGQ